MAESAGTAIIPRAPVPESEPSESASLGGYVAQLLRELEGGNQDFSRRRVVLRVPV